jgi:hypothetical protein
LDLREEFNGLKLSDNLVRTFRPSMRKSRKPWIEGADMISFGDQLLITQVGLYEQSSVEHIRLWALSKYDKVVDFVNRCHVGDFAKLRTTLSSSEIITYESLADEANNKNHELVGRNWYPPAIRAKPLSDDIPVATIAQVQQAITQVVLKDLKKVGITKPSGKTDPKQRSARPSSKDSVTEPGASKKKTAKDDKLPADFPQQEQAWRTHWPTYWSADDKSTSVFKFKGRKYIWCFKCSDGKGLWMYHNAACHGQRYLFLVAQNS